jgi:hypothetical protein
VQSKYSDGTQVLWKFGFQQVVERSLLEGANSQPTRIPVAGIEFDCWKVAFYNRSQTRLPDFIDGTTTH